MRMITLFIVAASLVHGQEKESPQYEMREYFFVMLKRGPNRGQDSLQAAQLQKGHMANIQRMADEGKLAIAGPFGDDGDWRGIFIMTVANKDAAVREVERDPAIQQGRLSYEIHPWWGARGSKLP